MKYRATILDAKEFPTDPRIIQNAIKKASQIDDDMRDVRDLQSILMRCLSAIPNLSRHRRRRVSSISSANWDITPIDEKFQDQADNAKMRLKTFIKEYTKYFTDGDLYGSSLLRLNYESSRYGLVPKILKKFKPYELEVNEDFNFGIALLKQLQFRDFERLEIPAEERQNHLVYIPEFEEPGGIMRTIVYACYMINLSRVEWAQYIQFLKGIIQAKVQTGASDSDKTAAFEAVQKAVQNKASVTTDLVEFTWERLNNENAYKAFDAFLQNCKEEIEIAITNSTMLATDRERNALTVQERNEEDLANDMRFELELLLNNQLLRHDYFMNVDKSAYPAEVPYEFKFLRKQKQDKTANARIINDLLDQGVGITAKEITEKTGINLAIEPTEVVHSGIQERLGNSFSKE